MGSSLILDMESDVVLPSTILRLGLGLGLGVQVVLVVDGVHGAVVPCLAWCDKSVMKTSFIKDKG